MAIESVNPSTGERWRSYLPARPDQIARSLQQVQSASRSWATVAFRERSARLMAAADVLRRNRDEYARLMAREMGKPVTQGQGECDKCASVCEYYAENGARLLAPELVKTEAARSLVAFEPIGVVLAVMPWNFPFWQVFRCAAPTLMAGNGLVLKHASNVPGCALAIEQVFREAGFPDGLMTSLLIDAKQVPALVSHPVIQAVSLTGSVSAGRAVAAEAGRCLKKTVLELGGSDPYVVLEDGDLEQAATLCVKSRLINSGQSCIAAKRFIVVESVRQGFEELFVAKLKSERVGDPLDAQTTVGPLAREDLRRDLHDQVQRSLAQGAKLLAGGEIPTGPGWFYPPTVLSDVRTGMAACDEETFGPVAAIISARDEEDAIGIANRSSFGLGSAVFTRDRARGERIARTRLQAGNCFVNDYVRSDPRLPYGGIKDSGYGRELSGFGLREFVNIKTVVVN